MSLSQGELGIGDQFHEVGCGIPDCNTDELASCSSYDRTSDKTDIRADRRDVAMLNAGRAS